MTQTGFIFRAGRTPVNGRTIANKVGPSVRKRETTGTHHLFWTHPLHNIYATPYDERRQNCCKEKRPTIAFMILWIILSSKDTRNNGSISCASTTIHLGIFYPLKGKANGNNNPRRVAGLYIRIGFTERNCERRKIYFCEYPGPSTSVSHTKYEYFTCRSRSVHLSCRCGCRRKREERREETSVK